MPIKIKEKYSLYTEQCWHTLSFAYTGDAKRKGTNCYNKQNKVIPKNCSLINQVVAKRKEMIQLAE